MKKNKAKSRRDFLKTTAASAAWLSLGTFGVKTSPAQGTAWTAGMRINPAIPNTRVVSCTDEKMISDMEKAKVMSTFAGTANQNTCINTARVEENMDAMAQALTGKPSAQEAWSTVFMKPAAKEWRSVKAAIKANCATTLIMPKIAVVNKVCVELMRLGVAAANITIYDAVDDASGSEKYTPFIGNGLPDGIVVSSLTREGVSVPVGSGTLQCCSVLARQDGPTIVYPTDILINCAVNKGHNTGYGQFTMCMKNHTGSIKFSCPTQEELIAMNQCEAIIGGTDGAPCRQQLCIVDSLWASWVGPTNPPDYLPCTISMGTLAPAVDYQVAMKIRKEVMNAPPEEKWIDPWLERFNINKTDLEWIVVLPAMIRKNEPLNADRANFHLMLDKGHFKRSSVLFELPYNADPQSVSIYNIRGNLVRCLKDIKRHTVVWDGKDQNGRLVPSGNYAVSVKAGSVTKSATLKLVR